MNIDRVKDIADAVLYEGYILYPYRPSSVKNRQRWTFGGVFPQAYAQRGGEASSMQTEVLLKATPRAEVDVMLRCLHSQTRQIGKVRAPTAELDETLPYDPVASLEVEGRQFVSWDEAIEQQLRITPLSLTDILSEPARVAFSFSAMRELEPIWSSANSILGVITRTREALEGVVEIGATEVSDGVFRLRVAIDNTTPLTDAAKLSRMEAQNYAFLSTHTIVCARGAEFVSLLEPPEDLGAEAAACDNRGTWPVLAGEETTRNMMLSSPIILYDYPRIAPESQSAFFDGAEIDELLTLRVLTLTDGEKRQMATADPRTRDILERCEALTKDEFGALHGVFRPPFTSGAASIASERGLAVGGRVRLNPRAQGDILDIALKGKVAVIEAIERDFEDRIHIAVTLLDDPGSDLGAAGFPGHRFFFSREEVEPIVAGEPS